MATMSLINDTLMLLFICTLCYLVWETVCSEFWNYVHGLFFISLMFFLLEIWAHHHDLQSKHSTKGPFIKDVDHLFIFLAPLSPMSAFATFYPFNFDARLPYPFKLPTFFMDGPQLNSPCERATLLLSFVKFDMVTRNDRASFPWIVTIHFFLEKKRRVRYLRQSYLHQNIKREFKFPGKNVENDTLSLQKGCGKLSLKIKMKRKYR